MSFVMSVPAVQVLTTLQWTGIAEQMNSCYQSLKKQQAGAEEDAEDLKERAQLFEEGILYCFCLKYMVAYDEDNQYILPAIKPHRQAMKYFSHHTGYVEIVRDKRLERLFFQLPDACLPGGPLDQPFVEMYDTDRSEVNRKNLQFIDNLVRLIKKEEHNSLIRASRLAFCVTR
ncbi:hypothetical protein T484DRAFT_1778031 [Baffinella frigidus]|nr:hypothetical protein T484DRAFT_1778031 [Cryptophyta sp. CCMP2293]